MPKKAKKVETKNHGVMKRRQFRITEKQRTIILVALILFAVIFIYWIQNGINENFVDTL